MIRLALIGGAAAYHGRAFSALINGAESIPEGWPASPKSVDGARIVTLWDENPEAARALARTFEIERVATDLASARKGVDAVIITDDGTSRHQEHARPFLEAGMPVFIDKPLASTAVEAREIIALAARHSAPVMSCSAVRFAAETAEFRANPSLLGTLETAVGLCQGELIYYGIHPLELAYSLMGPGIVSAWNIGEEDRNVVRLDYPDGRSILLLVGKRIPKRIQINLYGSDGFREIVLADQVAFYSGLLRAVLTLAETGRAPVPMEETLEIITVLEAATQSRSQGNVKLRI